MTDQPAVAQLAVATGFVPPMAFPPQLMMWAGMYTALFYVAGGMIAYLYNPD